MADTTVTLTGCVPLPCCCDCATITTDLHFTITGITACPDATLTGVNISGTLTYMVGGGWEASVGTATYNHPTLGELTGNGTLSVVCDFGSDAGNVFVAINYDGDLLGYNSFSSGAFSAPLCDPVSNTNTCGSFELGSGGTITLTR